MTRNRYLSGSVNTQMDPSDLQAKRRKRESQEDDHDQDGHRQMKKRSIQQILQEMDPGASKEQIAKFIKLVNEILKSCNIDDDKSNVVLTLMKIEQKLNDLCEARNILVAQDDLRKINHNHIDPKVKSIKEYETKVDNDRRDKKIAETKE